jgi:DNA-binding NarL/FixJ family response regulator
MSLKVLIVDDHEVARLGIRQLLRDAGFEVQDAVSGGDLLSMLTELGCDVVLLDVRMPGMDGLATLESIREIDMALPVVMLSSYDNLTYIARAAALGASDYVIKSQAHGNVPDCLLRAFRNEKPTPLSPMAKVLRIMAEEADISGLPDGFPLTIREVQVLRHVALGLSNKEIARSLEISVETVKEHVQNILRKVNANDRTDAAVRAIQCGIVDP